jgi:serine/threonine protein kinase
MTAGTVYPEDWPPDVIDQLSRIQENYVLKSFSSVGGNGYVCFAKNKIIGSTVAIKFYYFGGDKKFHAEPKTLQALSSHCENILAINDAGYAGDQWAYYITPYCSDGDLDTVIGEMLIVPRQVAALGLDILAGVSCLHADRLIHRDLKPANIYLDDGKAIIGDFGSIASIPEGETSIPASQHAICYRPPEACVADTYSFAGDIYQVGIVLYQLAGGDLSYNEENWLNAAERTKYKEMSFPDNTIFADECLCARIAKGKLLNLASLSPQLRAIIKKATQRDPTKRFKSALDMQVKLLKVKQSELEWEVEQDNLILHNKPASFRIVGLSGCHVEKRRSGNWKRDNSFPASSSREVAIDAIRDRVC